MTLVLLALLAQTPPQVAVIDISPEDAIYEDVSRRLAESLTEALTKDGVTAVRVDESELPREGCRLGPCLGVAARAKGALAVVTLDAEELSPTRNRVVVTMMRATNGEPLAGGRYELTAGAKKAPKGLLKFLSQAKKAIARVLASQPPVTP
ncbi:MAG: hypothetical protein ACOZQL_28535 [Myxococcota bacterium]